MVYYLCFLEAGFIRVPLTQETSPIFTLHFQIKIALLFTVSQLWLRPVTLTYLTSIFYINLVVNFMNQQLPYFIMFSVFMKLCYRCFCCVQSILHAYVLQHVFIVSIFFFFLWLCYSVMAHAAIELAHKNKELNYHHCNIFLSNCRQHNNALLCFDQKLCLQPTFTLLFCLAHSFTLKKEAICSSETYVDFQ